MRKLNHGIAAAALSAPLVLGVTGVASAAEFEQSSATAGPEGAGSSQVSSSADGGGQVSFQQSQASAGPDGASSSSIESSAGGSGEFDGGLLGDSEDGLLGLGLLG